MLKLPSLTAIDNIKYLIKYLLLTLIKICFSISLNNDWQLRGRCEQQQVLNGLLQFKNNSKPFDKLLDEALSKCKVNSCFENFTILMIF